MCKCHIYALESEHSLPTSPGPEKEPAAKGRGLQLPFNGWVWLWSGSRVIGILRQRTFCLHLRNLGEVSQVGPDPAQLVQHAGVEGRLLLAAAAQLLLVGVVDARPVGGEGLGAVRPDAPGDTTGTNPSANTAQRSSASLTPTSASGIKWVLSSQEHLNILSSQYLIQIPVT